MDWTLANSGLLPPPSSRSLGRKASHRLMVSAALAVSLLVACSPRVTLHGRLTSSSGTPLLAGEIRVECPELCAYAVVRDNRGNFSGSKVGRGCPVGCTLRVVSVGHQTLVAPAEKYCSKGRVSRCSDYEVNVELQASDPSGTATP